MLPCYQKQCFDSVKENDRRFFQHSYIKLANTPCIQNTLHIAQSALKL
jgi:hypothetical protein